MNPKEHREQVYSRTGPDALSWFQLHADRSLQLIGKTSLPGSARVIPVKPGGHVIVAPFSEDGLPQGRAMTAAASEPL